jgi:N-acetylneuraminate synthase
MTMQIGDRAIGGGARCFVIAEAGVNHNGSLDLAMRLVDAAADAGCDAVKFQTFDPAQLAAPSAAKAAYQEETTGGGSQLDMLRALALPAEAHVALQRRAAARGLVFLSTPFDRGSADLLDSLGVPAFKISSGDLTNELLLAHVARKGRPMLLSTGMATVGEVAAALDAVAAAGDPPIALFHCVSNYPTAPEDVNLRAMATLRTAFARPTGWSDHTDGIDISVAAVALGAELLEKHFTIDRNLPGPDHRASLEPRELVELVRAVRRVEAALGDGRKRPRPAERPIAALARRSLAYAASLAAGARIEPDSLTTLRPGTGLRPALAEMVVGRRLRRSVQAGELVRREDLE